MPTLILLRHGESEWNAKNLFTGWVDVDLNDKGLGEARRGGELLAEAGLLPDVVHTSLLKRAIKTSQLALEACDRMWIPVVRNWRLNERHYGALQGLDKKATTEQYGAEQTKLWRRSYDIPPPPVDLSSPEHPIHDARYRLLPPDVLPPRPEDEISRSEQLEAIVLKPSAVPRALREVMALLDAEPRNTAWLAQCDPMQAPLHAAGSWADMEQVYFNA
jgi:2,3-bisphosphoglycerate-dependent phosphoglycerate mutase